MESEKIRVGITHGDTNGIGYELILKAFADQALCDLCIPILYGSVKVANFHRKVLNLATEYTVVNSAKDAICGRLNMVNCFENELKMEIGTPTEESGRAAYLSLEKAVEDYHEGNIDVLVTCPISKHNIYSEDFHFIGHTDYLEHVARDGQEALMILMNSMMRVALVTTHLPLKDVSAAITKEKIERKIDIFNTCLHTDFMISIPRIAVLALNPHSGDDGLLGTEEQNVISPAIQSMREKNVQCFGPYSADGFFGAGLYTHFDGILAMYHDQGLAPFKALSMSDGVNFTAGLPIVRTSPDHGTAFDIAGKGEADENSFRQAIYSAIDIWKNRKHEEEISTNPLKIVPPERDSHNYTHHAPQQQIE
jgi:4-hydroxythreonine-4-phosphate dehydrogenase